MRKPAFRWGTVGSAWGAWAILVLALAGSHRTAGADRMVLCEGFTGIG
jgi:hypothetical protein